MSARFNALRGLRPVASRFQPRALPQLVRRSSSASAAPSYEFIEVSEPRPGVGQGTENPPPPLFLPPLPS